MPSVTVRRSALTATPKEAREQQDFLTVLQVSDGPMEMGTWPWVGGAADACMHAMSLPSIDIPQIVLLKRHGADAVERDGLSTDGDAVAYFSADYFAANATRADWLEFPLLRSTSPADVAFSRADGVGTANVSLQKPASLSVRVWEEPGSVTLNGQAADYEYADGMVTVDLEAGEHVVECQG